MDEGVLALRQTAEAAARAGGAVLRARFGGPLRIERKGEIDLVTDADRASEAAVLGLLRERHPEHAILAEESGASGHASPTGLRWIVDPLDGTTNYAHGLPHFSVSVAVEGPEGLVAGCVYDPLRDELFSAGLGMGATRNGETIRVSGATELLRALLCTGFPYDVREHAEAPLGLVSRFLKRGQGLRRLGSAALDLCYVASGRYDGYFELGLKPWDVAAGALIVREAGGFLRSLDGSPFRLSPGHVLACTPGIAEGMLAEIRGYLDEVDADFDDAGHLAPRGR